MKTKHLDFSPLSVPEIAAIVENLPVFVRPVNGILHRLYNIPDDVMSDEFTQVLNTICKKKLLHNGRTIYFFAIMNKEDEDILLNTLVEMDVFSVILDLNKSAEANIYN